MSLTILLRDVRVTREFHETGSDSQEHVLFPRTRRLFDNGYAPPECRGSRVQACEISHLSRDGLVKKIPREGIVAVRSTDVVAFLCGMRPVFFG